VDAVVASGAATRCSRTTVATAPRRCPSRGRGRAPALAPAADPDGEGAVAGKPPPHAPTERTPLDPEPSWSWPPGHELAPGLLAWALLGDGRRCETWLAWDVGRWCPVAVKLPRPGQPGHGPVRARGGPIRAGHRHPGLRGGRPGPAGAPLAAADRPATPAQPPQPGAASGPGPGRHRPADPRPGPPAGRRRPTLALLEAALPADAAEEDRLWPGWATPRLGAWQASTMARPPLAPRPA
jgi:hypothetical protein